MKHPKKYRPTKKLRRLSRKDRKRRDAWPNFFKGAVIGFAKAAGEYFEIASDPKHWEKLNSMLETTEQYEKRTGTPYVEKYKWSFNEEKSQT